MFSVMARKLERRVPKSKRPKNARRLLDLRKKKGWTQKQLAEAFNVESVTIEKWEMGERNMSGPAEVLLDIFEERFKGKKE
jgi:transcriptional regulator with XRE-family HTH domain